MEGYATSGARAATNNVAKGKAGNLPLIASAADSPVRGGGASVA
jgi:hypothetical protein